MTYQEVSANLSQFLNSHFPQSLWFVYTYQNLKSHLTSAWNCKSCFAMFDVANHYHILVARIGRDLVPNKELVNDEQFVTMIDGFANAKSVANEFYSDNCLLGVFASSNGVEIGYSGPDYEGLALVKGKNKYKVQAYIWAVKGYCPSQEDV